MDPIEMTNGGLSSVVATYAAYVAVAATAMQTEKTNAANLIDKMLPPPQPIDPVKGRNFDARL